MAFGNDVDVKIGLNASDLSKGLSKTQQEVASWASGIERASQGPRSALYGLMHLNPYTALAGSIGLLVGAIGAASFKFSGFLNGIQKQADALDISTDAYQRFQYAAGRANVGMEKVENFVTRFTNKIAEAKEGSKDAVKLFDKLGLSISEMATKSPDQAFNTLLKRLAQIKAEGQDITQLVSDLFGRRAIMDINKLIANNGFLNDQNSATGASQVQIRQAEQLQNEWEKLKNVFTAFLASVVEGTKIFNALNFVMKNLSDFLHTMPWVKEIPDTLGKQTKEDWRNDVDSAMVSLTENLGYDLETQRTYLRYYTNSERYNQDPEYAQKQIDKIRKKIDKMIDDEMDELVKSTNSSHLKQVFADKDIRTVLKYIWTDRIKDGNTFEGRQDFVDRTFADRTLTMEEYRQQALNEPPPQESNREFIYQKLNQAREDLNDKLEIERRIKIASIKEDEEEVQILKELNRLREAGIEISEKEFRLNLSNNAVIKEEQAKKWYDSTKENIKSAQNDVKEEADVKKEVENAKKRKELIKSLELEQQKLGLNNFEEAAIEARYKAEEYGMNQNQADAYAEYKKVDKQLEWLKKLRVEGFKEDVYTNDLARRGGFASSVTTWQKSSDEKIFEWLKQINEVETTRNSKLDTLIKVLGE